MDLTSPSRRKHVDEVARLAAIHAKVPVTDVAALDDQVSAKKAGKAADAAEERALVAQLLSHAVSASKLQALHLEKLAQERRAFAEYNHSQVAAEKPSEGAVNDEPGPAAGVASLRSFEGEDTGYGARRKKQAIQLAGWCAEAIAAHEVAAEKARLEAEEERASLSNLLEHTFHLTSQQHARRAALAVSVAEANPALAAVKRERDAQAVNERGAAEAKALLVDTGPVRGALRTEFRGLTRDQLEQDVLAVQERQRAEALAARNAEKEATRSGAVEAALVQKSAEKVLLDTMTFQQKQRAAVAAQLQLQVKAKEVAEQEAAKERSSPAITEHFQARFGRHAR
jgi:hypothetical protein